jgi:WhiB family redox-sensing transcriptional regulator
MTQDIIEDDDTCPENEVAVDWSYKLALPKLRFPDADDAWRDLSMCSLYPNVDFFRFKFRTEAKSICGECIVRKECLDFALRNDERHGVWGGLDPDERKALQ